MSTPVSLINLVSHSTGAGTGSIGGGGISSVLGSVLQASVMNALITNGATRPPRPSITSPPATTTTTITNGGITVITTSTQNPDAVPQATFTGVTKTPGLKRALLIGINYYGTSVELGGCVSDTTNMKTLLNTYFPSCEVKTLNDTPALPADSSVVANFPTGQHIIDGINWLVSGLKEGENVFLHYSGHGTTVADLNGDESNGIKADSCIVGIDIRTNANNNKIYQLQLLTDDYLRAYLANRIPKNTQCFALFDSCNSGTGMDLRYNYTDINDSLVPTLVDNTKYSDTIGNVVFLSGSTDDGLAYDTIVAGQGQGALTNSFITNWNSIYQNTDKTINLKQLYNNIHKALIAQTNSQNPQLSAGRSDIINIPFKL